MIGVQPKIDKPYAEIDRRGGRAAIVEPSGKLWIVDIADGNPLQDGEGVHMGMFLQPGMTHLEFKEAGEFPFVALINYIRQAYFQESCLMMVLLAIDPHLGSGLRTEALTMATAFMKTPGTKDWLVQRLAEMLPNLDADVAGLPHGQLKTLLRGVQQN